jgi:hypothetical protein
MRPIEEGIEADAMFVISENYQNFQNEGLSNQLGDFRRE